MKTLELKEITVEYGQTYDLTKYTQGNGLYLVTEGTFHPVLYSHIGGTLLWLGDPSNMDIKEVHEYEGGKVTEALLLKALAIAHGQSIKDIL